MHSYGELTAAEYDIVKNELNKSGVVFAFEDKTIKFEIKVKDAFIDNVFDKKVNVKTRSMIRKRLQSIGFEPNRIYLSSYTQAGELEFWISFY